MTLAERLRRARGQAFVGRAAEPAHFRHLLRGEPDSPAVLFLYASGGLGKSTLLHRFADEARDCGRPVVEVDGRHTGPTPQDSTAAIGDGLPARAVLLIDAFERCQGIEDWLREGFLPTLPHDAVTVIASRCPPSARWLADLAWQRAMSVRRLNELSLEEARDLLRARGLAPVVHDRVIGFAGTHPLALTLAAMDAAGAARRRDRPRAQLRTPKALEVAAHAMTTTEGLLRTVVDPDLAGELFTWLRRLPAAGQGRRGLHLHRLAGEIIDAELRWRDPDRYARMHAQMGRYLLEQVRNGTDSDAMAAINELTALKRHSSMGRFFPLRREHSFREDTLRPGDETVLLRFAAETEGAASAAVVACWLRRQPGAFRVYRDDTGRPVGFLCSLRLIEPPADDAVAEAAWSYAQHSSPLRPGEHLRLTRYCIYPAASTRPPTTRSLRSCS